MKKTLSIIMALVMVFSLAAPCAAVEQSGETDWGGFNISDVCPFERMNQPTPFGVDAPTTSYDLHANALYSFHGNASWSRLWLSKYLYGCTRYSVYINNKSSEKLVFTVRGISGGDQQFTLPGNTDTVAYFGSNGMTFSTNNVKTLFCISFEAPSNFEGWVCCAD